MIRLPWPPSILSGHAKGSSLWLKIEQTKKQRIWAFNATCEVLAEILDDIPATGDIPIRITFTPPNNRGDRVNFPNRMKAAIDGIAEALGVNDKRFVPSYVFMLPQKPGGVLVEVMAS